MDIHSARPFSAFAAQTHHDTRDLWVGQACLPISALARSLQLGPLEISEARSCHRLQASKREATGDSGLLGLVAAVGRNSGGAAAAGGGLGWIKSRSVTSLGTVHLKPFLWALCMLPEPGVWFSGGCRSAADAAAGAASPMPPLRALTETWLEPGCPSSEEQKSV